MKFICTKKNIVKTPMMHMAAAAAAFLIYIYFLYFLDSADMNLFDKQILERISALRSSFLDTAAFSFSIPFNVSCMLILLPTAIIGSYIYKKKSLAYSLLLSSAGAALSCTILKLIASRPRPDAEFMPIFKEYGYSMPSGHSASAAAAFMLLVLFVCRSSLSPFTKSLLSVSLIILMLGTALSRIYLAVHYPCDISAGLCLGASWAFLSFCMFAKE